LQDGQLRPKDLRAVAPDAAKILLNSVYGWFDRVDRGLYAMTDLGKQALLRWPVSHGTDMPVALRQYQVLAPPLSKR
jgi:hypothetical protein